MTITIKYDCDFNIKYHLKLSGTHGMSLSQSHLNSSNLLDELCPDDINFKVNKENSISFYCQFCQVLQMGKHIM